MVVTSRLVEPDSRVWPRANGGNACIGVVERTCLADEWRARWLFATIVTDALTAGDGRPPARIVLQHARRRFTAMCMSLDQQGAPDCGGHESHIPTDESCAVRKSEIET